MNPYLPILLLGAAFAFVVLATLAVGSVMLGRAALAEKIDRRIGLEDTAAGEVPVETLAREASGRFDRYFYRVLTESGLSLSPWTVLAMMVGMSLIAAGVAFLFVESLGLAAAAALVGFWPPWLWVLWVRGRRIRAMELLMPAALDQIADCLHGGQTLEQAAESVSLQSASPLKEEFGHCLRLLKMGQSPVAVMDRMSRRIPLAEFRLFATAVLVHRQTGGNLAQLTSRLAISARDRQQWRRHLAAQTVAGRYSVVGLVACGVIGLLVLSLNRPEYTGFFLSHPRGPVYLAFAVALMLVGLVWVSRVIRVNY